MVDFRLSRRHAVFAGGLAALFMVLILFLPPQARSSLWRGFLAQRLLILLLVGFCLVTLSLLWSTGQRIDTWIFLALNLRGRRPAWLDWLMIVLTQIGNGALAFSIALIYYLSGARRLGVLIVLGTLSLWLVVETLKAVTERTRPFKRLSKARVVGYRERGMSFPSGHTAQTFFLMSVFIQFHHLGPAWAIGLFLLAVFVGLTRIYMGMHYPRDVIAGAILGSVWGLLVALAEPYLVEGLVAGFL